MKSEDVIAQMALTIRRHRPPYNRHEMWRVGVTQNPCVRRVDYQHMWQRYTWRYWPADSLKDARDVKGHFAGSGCNTIRYTGGNMRDGEWTYVYLVAYERAFTESGRQVPVVVEMEPFLSP